MDRERVWMATTHGDMVTVRHYAVLEPGEELTETPPTEVMTSAEWLQRHEEFDCDADGQPHNPQPGVGA